MRKLLIVMLISLVMVSSMGISAYGAEDMSQTYLFNLTANDGSNSTAIKVGDKFTVKLTLTRLSPATENEYLLYTMGDDIIYDDTVFEVQPYSGQEAAEIKAQGFSSSLRTDKRLAISTNTASSIGTGLSCPKTMEVAKITFKVIGKPADGIATISNRNYKIVAENSFDVYSSSAKDLQVKIEDDGTNTGSGSTSGNGKGSTSSTPRGDTEVTDTGTPLSRSAFTDVSGSHWAQQYIYYLADRGFVTGKSSTLFAPSDSVTRAEFVTILARMSKESLPQVGNSGFHDVESGAYYGSAVAWASAAGITKGVSETAFSPTNLITRQDMATMIARYADHRKYVFSSVNEKKEFADDGMIQGYAKEPVRMMQQASIINGYEDGSFRPTGNTTRAETAKMLAIVDQLMEK